MQQAGALGQRHIDAKLRRHDAGDVGDFNGMQQHVLSIARAIAQTAEQLDKLGVQPIDAGLEGGALALLLDGVFHISAGFFHRLLDLGGVDAPVVHKALKRNARDFTPHRVKAGDGDGLGRVVDDEVNAGHGLDGADVAPLAADDASLHLVGGQRHHRNGGLSHKVGGIALDRHGDDLPGALLALLLGALLALFDAQRRFMLDFIFQVVEQIFLCLVDGEAGDALKRLPLLTSKLLDLLFEGFGFFEFAAQLFLFLFIVLAFFVERFLFLLNASFLLADLAAALLELLFYLSTQMNGFLFRFQGCFFFLCLRTFNRLVDNSAGFDFGLADLRLRDLLSI